MNDDFAMAFEFPEDQSFDLICPDCDQYLWFISEQPSAGEPGFHSNLSLGAVVKAAREHKCEYEEPTPEEQQRTEEALTALRAKLAGGAS
jgi:hypothetical protein